MTRLMIVGTPGAGKSTLGQNLFLYFISLNLKVRWIELDDITVRKPTENNPHARVLLPSIIQEWAYNDQIHESNKWPDRSYIISGVCTNWIEVAKICKYIIYIRATKSDIEETMKQRKNDHPYIKWWEDWYSGSQLNKLKELDPTTQKVVVISSDELRKMTMPELIQYVNKQ